MLRSLIWLVSIAAISLPCLSQIATSAEVASGTADDPVEIVDEPMHHVRMQNDVIRVYEAVIPGNSATLFHRHHRSGVGIDMTPNRLGVEKVGAEATEEKTKSGDFFPVNAASPYVHRVINFDPAVYRVIVAERNRDSPLGVGSSTLAGTAGYKQELETDLVVAYRLTLRPGESTGLHTIRRNTLIVSISGGQIALDQAGQPSMLRSLAPGDLEFMRKTQSLKLTNHGVSEYVAAFFEWK